VSEGTPAADAPAAAPKEDPETLVLRGTPRPVVRFRRGLIIGVTGLVSACLVAVTWFALEPPSFRIAAGEEKGDTLRRATRWRTRRRAMGTCPFSAPRSLATSGGRSLSISGRWRRSRARPSPILLPRRPSGHERRRTWNASAWHRHGRLPEPLPCSFNSRARRMPPAVWRRLGNRRQLKVRLWPAHRAAAR
jgi:hypothetical protein